MKTTLSILLTASMFLGCGETSKRAELQREEGNTALEAAISALPDAVPSFARHVPEEFRTALTAGDGQPSSPSVIIDARDGKVLFPLRKEPRTFASMQSLNEALKESFGAVESKSGRVETLADALKGSGAFDSDASPNSEPSFHGTSVQYGTSLFHDPNPGISYRITDPLLAYVGGAFGVVRIADASVCVDPDGTCGDTYASYLEPVGSLTIPTHRPACGPPFSNGTAVCVEHHSFWNDYTVFARWIRHGSNVRFTSYSALPTSVLQARSRIFYNYTSSPTSGTFYLPLVETTGENSAETAAFCWGGCPEYLSNAVVVCGQTTVVDPDVSGVGLTGNGPAYDPTDLGWQCP